ncbi:MAG: LAGLIDADG family homing endonuclease [Candidatus Doudnabacteria bacterium]|nr:LAGLIDADG family homing endonuclease [Candidatus Doudnabacteria bacterium]
MWYTVGLIATDGNLSKDGRHTNITSKDEEFLEGVKKILGLNVKLTKKTRTSEKNKKYSFLQIGDVKFYKFLLEIGLTPKKSLTLGELRIPEIYFKDFFRGVIDGDGSISTWIHNSNGNIQWSSRVVSGSKKFIYWLQEKSENSFNIKGKVHIAKKIETNPLYVLKFGKFATKNLLNQCYYKQCFALRRKYLLAEKCLNAEDKLSKYGIHARVV